MSPKGGVRIEVDQAMVQQITAQGVVGLRPRILFSRPITSAHSFFGLMP